MISYSFYNTSDLCELIFYFWSKTKNVDKNDVSPVHPCCLMILKPYQLLNRSNQYNLQKTVFALTFHLLAWKPNLEIFTFYSNKFFHNFHLSEYSFTCLELQASVLAWRLKRGKKFPVPGNMKNNHIYYIMILFKQFYWLSCCHLTFRKIWYCLIKTRIDRYKRL